MATDKKQLSIQIVGDASKFQDELKKAIKGVDDFKGKIGKQLKDSGIGEKMAEDIGKAFDKGLSKGLETAAKAAIKKNGSAIGKELGKEMLSGIGAANLAGGINKQLAGKISVGKHLFDGGTNGLISTFGTSFARNMKNVFTGLKKDWDNIRTGIKTGTGAAVTAGAVTGAAGVAIGLDTADEYRQVQKQEVITASKNKFSDADRKIFDEGVKKLSEVTGKKQSDVYKAATDLFSGSRIAEQGPKASLDALEQILKSNIAGGSQEDISSTVTNIIGYLNSQNMGVDVKNIKYAGDLLQKTADISAGNDVLVKQYVAQSGALPKFAGLKPEEQMALFATITGATGNEAEAATQTERMAQSMFDFTPGMIDTFQKMGINESPQAIIKRVGLKGYLDVLKKHLPQKIQEGFEEIQKKKEEMAKLDKENIPQYLDSTETIDPKTGKYVRTETDASIKKRKDIAEKKAKLQEDIDEIKKKASFEQDPFIENLAKIEPNVRGLIPALFLLTDGYDRYTENLDALNNAQGSVDKSYATISGGIDQQLSIQEQRWKNLKVSIGEAVGPAILDAFTKLNDIILKNKDAILKFVNEGIKVLGEWIGNMVKWIGENQDKIEGWKNDFIDFKNNVVTVFNEIKDTMTPVFEYIKSDVIPIIKDLWEGFKTLSPEMKTAIIFGVLFHNTLFAIVGMAGSLVGGIATLAGAMGTAATTGGIGVMAATLAGMATAMGLIAGGAAIAYAGFSVGKVKDENNKTVEEAIGRAGEKGIDLETKARRDLEVAEQNLYREQHSGVFGGDRSFLGMGSNISQYEQAVTIARNNLENIKKKNKGKVIPEMLDLTSDKKRVQSMEDIFGKNSVNIGSTLLKGTEVDIFNQNKEILNSVPSILQKVDTQQDVIRTELDRLVQNNLSNKASVNVTVQGNVISAEELTGYINKALNKTNTINGLTAQY